MLKNTKSNLLKRLGVLLILLFCAFEANALPNEQNTNQLAEEFQSIQLRSGKITLPNKIATLNLKNGYYFINKADTRKLLVDLMHNPPVLMQDVIGAITPNKQLLASKNRWFVIIRIFNSGYITDKNAKSINYDKLLKRLKIALKQENQSRQEHGYARINLKGWAEPPHYDSKNHKLYWAKQIRFSDHDYDILNYQVRILGRSNVLSLVAVTDMSQLKTIKPIMNTVMKNINFNAGHRYIDFNPKIDKAAGYGIAGLIAGVAVTKLGLFAKLGVLLLALKKFIIAGIVAIGVFFKRLFGRKKPFNEVTNSNES